MEIKIQHTRFLNIPIIPMVKILTQYAVAFGLPMNRGNWESIVRTFEIYKSDAEKLN